VICFGKAGRFEAAVRLRNALASGLEPDGGARGAAEEEHVQVPGAEEITTKVPGRRDM
jgi:hypothetical protein